MKYLVFYKGIWIPVTKEEFLELPLLRLIINPSIPRKRKRDETLKNKFHIIQKENAND